MKPETWYSGLMSLMLLFYTAGRACARDYRPVTSFKFVNAAHLVVTVNWPDAPALGRELFVLTVGGRKFVPKSLNEFKGAIYIADANEALSFVRLLTSYSTWYLWDTPQSEVEVVEVSQVGTIPNYGLQQLLPSSHGKSGLFGVLSAQAYRIGGFVPPRVQKTVSGFEITRWVFVSEHNIQPRRLSVQQIHESIGVDGKYKRTILKRMKPPNLPDTFWDIYGFA